MLGRLWRLLDAKERRSVLAIVPLLVLSAFVEVVGVAAVIPFLAVLTDPASAGTLPIVGPWLASEVGTSTSGALRWAGLVLAAALVVANTLVIITNWWLHRFSWGLNHSVSARLLRHYLAQPYAFLLGRNTAMLTNRVLDDVRNLITQGVQAGLEVMTRSVIILALVVFLVVLDPLTAVVALGVLGSVYSLIFLASRRYLARAGRELVAVGAARLKAVNEALGGLKDLRVTGREHAAYTQYLGPSRRYGQVNAAATAIGVLPRYALEAISVGGLVIIATLMSGRPDAAMGTLPLLGAYAFAGMRMMPAMQLLFSAVTRLRFVTGAAEAVEGDLLLTRALEHASDEEPPPLSFERTIEFRGVTYAYPDSDNQALRNVSMAIVRNRSLAIVGRTGSGKTTAVDILLGLLEPQSGTILLDGVPVAPEMLRSYRRLFGYVPQSIFLLDDSIARNVAFGLPPDRVDIEAVKLACHQAQIAEFVETELADGYDTRVGERGVRLSGGQRQRIGIARALYHQPPILVFDEATSALDVHTEQRVYEALHEIARERTLVTIAHRLDTVASADHVVVLDAGRLVDEGPPEAVLERYRAPA